MACVTRNWLWILETIHNEDQSNQKLNSCSFGYCGDMTEDFQQVLLEYNYCKGLLILSQKRKPI